MDRTIFSDEHEAFRATVRSFIADEVEPYHEKWERDGVVARDVWSSAGRAGLLGVDVDPRYGGSGKSDYRYYAALNEEMFRARAHGPAFYLHNDIIGQYLHRLATPEQRQRWLPGYCSGELITAVAITEPGGGSDIQGIQTSAVDRGDHYELNGQKTLISNGQLADLVIVAARTDPDAKNLGYTLLVVERGMDGFARGRNLEKVGMSAQDTSELSFTDVRVPKENRLGREGHGFIDLMKILPRERVTLGVIALAGAEKTFEDTLAHCKQRRAFGHPIGRFQHNRFVLAEMSTELAVAREFTDRCIVEHDAGRLTTGEASMVKWWNTELCKRVVDRCVQLHGGHGCVLDCPVAHDFVDSRLQTIYGGTTEIMKEIVGHELGV